MADDSELIPDEVRERHFNICKQFLGKTWAKISFQDFQEERISGGLSNLMYLCSLPDQVISEKNEPRKVILRIYGQIIQENPENVVINSVVYALLAEKKMGPKLWGLFTGGRVEEYVNSRVLNCKELWKPDISMCCAEIMAQFHMLTMPLIKEPVWLVEVMTRFLDEALNNVTFHDFDVDRNEKLQKVMSYKLATEFQCLKNILSQVHSPVVFCHNDMQEGNILYCEDQAKGSWKLVPIDFEYASYNWRGFDIANHMCEWCYDYHVNKPPYFTANLKAFPNKDQQRKFFETYLQTLQVPPEKFESEIKSLHLEVQVFALASHFMWGLWSIVQSQMSGIKFGYLEYALVRFEAYFEMKKVAKQMLQCQETNMKIEGS